jgi:hypothetical protein
MTTRNEDTIISAITVESLLRRLAPKRYYNRLRPITRSSRHRTYVQQILRCHSCRPIPAVLTSALVLSSKVLADVRYLTAYVSLSLTHTHPTTLQTSPAPSTSTPNPLTQPPHLPLLKSPSPPHRCPGEYGRTGSSCGSFPLSLPCCYCYLFSLLGGSTKAMWYTRVVSPL